MKEMREKILNNDNDLYRLFYHLFVLNQNIYLIDYIISLLNITKEKISAILEHKYPAPPSDKFGNLRAKYDKMPIIGGIAFDGTVDVMKHLCGIIGEDLFCKHVFVKDGWGDTAIVGAVEKKKLAMVKCILSIKPVKEKLLADDSELGAVLEVLNRNFEDSVAKYLVNELDLTETKLYELNEMYSFDVKQILSVNV